VVEYHNAILADSPSYTFFGTFYGGLADQDGSFTWKSHVEFNVHRTMAPLRRCASLDQFQSRREQSR
jgi:hypothetical protein